MDSIEARRGVSLGTVLIVDDDEHTRTMIASLARQFGFERVVEVAAIADALDRLAIDVIALALIDLSLGDEDGAALIGAIRVHPRQRVQEMPIVVVSRCTDETRVLSAIKAGANGFIAKPLTVANFYRQLSNAMHQRVRRPIGLVPPRQRLETDAGEAIASDVFEIE